MLRDINTCDCLNKLILIGVVEAYDPNLNNLSDYSDYNVEKGTLCFSEQFCHDYGDYNDDLVWVDNIVIERRLYPIVHCPICGKKIEYEKVKSLKMKM